MQLVQVLLHQVRGVLALDAFKPILQRRLRLRGEQLRQHPREARQTQARFLAADDDFGTARQRELPAAACVERHALDLHAGYAYLDAELRSGAFKGNEVPFSSKHQLTVDGRYRFAESWTYSLDGLYVSSAYSDETNSDEENATASVGELPAYWVWNTAIEREFKLQDDSILTASAGVSNLFDRGYYFRGIDTSPLGRQPAPGRTLTLGVNYRF